MHLNDFLSVYGHDPEHYQLDGHIVRFDCPNANLGHADISITLNTYTHVLDSVKREAVDKLSLLFPGID